MKAKVEFFGYIVRSEGIKPDPIKIKSIENLLPHANLKELKSFLRMTSFNPYYAKMLHVLQSSQQGKTHISKSVSSVYS